MSKPSKRNQKSHSQTGADVYDLGMSPAEGGVVDAALLQIEDRPVGAVRELDWVALDRQTRRAQLGLTLAEPLTAQASALTLSLDAVQVRTLLPLLYQTLATMQAPAGVPFDEGTLVPLRVEAWEVLSTPDASQFVLHFQAAQDMGMRFSLGRTEARELARAILAVDVAEELPFLN